MPLPQLPADKANHCIYGLLCGAVGAIAALQLGLSPLQAGLAGVALAAAVGLGKEGADWVLNLLAQRRGEAPPHGVEPLDALATVAGSLPLAVVLRMLEQAS